VLMVQPKTNKRVFEQESFFLDAALNPAGNSSNSSLSGFVLSQAAPEELAAKLAGARGSVPSDLVIVPALKNIPAGMGQAFAAFVRAGGGVLFFVGEGLSANRYNSEFRELLPAQLGAPELNPGLGGWRVAEYTTNSPAFAAFRLPNSGDLRIPEFTKRFSLSGAESAFRLAFFDDGVPLLITRALGRGQVALVNSSADTSWNDWPKHKTFVPWLHSLAKDLAKKAGTGPAPQNNRCLAGLDLEIETGAKGKRAEFSVGAPDGKDFTVIADDQGRLRDRRLGPPGVYSVRAQDSKESRRVAVNLPIQESDLDALRPNDFQQQLVRVQDPKNPTLIAGFFGSQNIQKQLWTTLLLAALVLLLLEPIVANRTTA